MHPRGVHPNLMTAREEGVKSEKRGNEREREKEKKGETKEGKEKEGFSTLARIYRSTFEDSGCGMKNRCIHHGLVDHRGSMEPCRNKPMPFIMIHPSIDRSHKCARHKSSWRGSFGFGFLSFFFFQDGNDSSSSSREKFIAYLER